MCHVRRYVHSIAVHLMTTNHYGTSTVPYTKKSTSMKFPFRLNRFWTSNCSLRIPYLPTLLGGSKFMLIIFQHHRISSNLTVQKELSLIDVASSLQLSSIISCYIIFVPGFTVNELSPISSSPLTLLLEQVSIGPR